ncbi:uncharacterized protein LOC135168126 [Diachasmimorpha longicaudata]|uniref:uncharacterized protein LOC135168126 n=1 Tax=Diachasmimorpha longicaudata TaxID=58733 RepID=UPI0030B8D0FE
MATKSHLNEHQFRYFVRRNKHISKKNTSIVIPPFIGGREVIGTAFIKQGISEEAIPMMVNSITDSARRQYESGLKLWWNHAHRHVLDIYNAQSRDVINVVPALNFLQKLPPLKELKLKEASEKVSTLLALTTAQRLQTFALININNISFTDTGITIKITELIKTSRPGAYQPELILPFCNERPGLCVATAVKDYLTITKDLRKIDSDKLFITSVKPHGPASSQTIGHWIKVFLKKAGVQFNQKNSWLGSEFSNFFSNSTISLYKHLTINLSNEPADPNYMKSLIIFGILRDNSLIKAQTI